MLPFITPRETQQMLTQRLKDLRLEQGWSRAELAERSGVNINTLIRFERTGNISLERFLILCFTLSRITDFENLLKPIPKTTMNELIKQQHKRQRGKKRQHGTD